MTNEIKEIFELYEKQVTNSDLKILIKTLKEWYFEKVDYKSRNDKAIEYIENDLKLNNYFELTEQGAKDLLDILKGEENEVK